MDSITQAHAHLLQDATIQLDRGLQPQAAEAPPAIGWEGSWQAGSWLFWTLIAILVVATALFVVRGFRAYRAKPPARDSDAAIPAPEQLQQVLTLPASVLPAADALAGQARYGDAVHLLLLRGILAIERQFPRTLAPSHTSRDITRLDALPAAVRTAFSGIASTAERSVFAGRELTLDDWQACRSLYDGLTRAARR
jgi:hypothetical protein